MRGEVKFSSPGTESFTLSSRRVLAQFAGMLACVNLICAGANAQVAGGVLSGFVTAAQRAMPNARVTIRNVATGVERVATTNDGGLYTVPNLVPGTYEMTVDAAGFSTQVRTDIALAVGAKLVVNVTMQQGDPKEVIRAAAAGATEDQGSSAGNANVSSSTVRDSPLNGRDWTQLAALEAGVTGVQTGAVQALRGFGAAISVSGARPDQNSYRLDGISINDYSNGAPGSVLGSNLGVDAVEQFSVLGSNYPAGYGRTSGGVINAVTRSGTNGFHGDVYEFLRNSALDARNFFDSTIPPFKRNQFGASAGGPIQKERTFVFADYEGLRQSLGVTHVDTVPSLKARQGQLSTGTVQVDPAVARFLNAFYPLPNGPILAPGDTAEFIFADQTVTSENYFTTKIDHTFSARDSVSGTYLRDNSDEVQPDAMDELLSSVVSRRQLVTLHEQHIFSPKFLNATRLGFDRAVAIEGGVSKVNNPLLKDPAFGFVPGEYVGWVMGVPGLTDFGGGLNPALPNTLSNSRNYTWNSYQWADDAVFTKGKHVLQFGLLAERMQDNLLSTLYVDGGFKFGSLADFLTNRPRNFEGVVPRPIPMVGLRETLFGAYTQDDIRARPGLNLSLGMRYEMTTVPSEVNNLISNLDHLTDSLPRVGSPFFHNPTLRNFEPRVGVAWSPFPDNKTIVRSGFGIFDVLPLPYEFTLTIPNAAPFAAQIFAESLPQGAFPTGAYQQFSGSSTVSRAGYTEHDPKRNYVMQWNVNLERQLASSLTATLGYVGSHGVHEPYRQDNFDTVLPTLTAAGYLYPPLGTSQPLNPNFGRISGTLWQAGSSYNALQAVITKSLSHGIQLHGAYTWSKSIDTLSATVADDSFPNGLMNPLFFDQHTSRGLSDFDVRQNFVVNLTWEAPAPKTGLRVTRWALSGWQLGGIYKASSGQPFTPILGGDPLGTMLDETAEPPNRGAGPGCEMLSNPGNPDHYIKMQCLAFPNPANLRGNLGRNTVIGPGLANLDFSLFKNDRLRNISESCSVQFRAEFFNVFNRANFASPTDNRTVFDQSGIPTSSAGLITSTQTPSRQIQFALKLIW
jgi:hypothetical protein